MTLAQPPFERRRLPGVRFEHETQHRTDALPRMDVAVFVGFSAQAPHGTAGPVPVAVDDVRQFERLFGGDLELGWDHERGEPVLAHLPRAVRAFFENGGRRCWVVRVEEALDREAGDPFLDPDLADAPLTDLLRRADDLRYRAPVPRPLEGIHAALGVEEATLIAVPDLVHRWRRHALRAAPASPAPAAPEVEPVGPFRGCADRPLLAPQLAVTQPDAEHEPLVVHWGAADASPARPAIAYVLEEATRPDFADAAVVYAGPARSVGRHPPRFGWVARLWYRVRAESGAERSPWSATASVVPPWQAPPLEVDAAADDAGLLRAHRALLRLCAARGDLFAVLALPGHFRSNEAHAYVDQLRAHMSEGADADALGFGALYHPWLVAAAGDARAARVPPDGAATGLLARRARERGAWVAPANEPLRGVVGLEPAVPPTQHQAWAERPINLVRHEAKGFVTLAADTLSDDPVQPWRRSIHVRRLLTLVRRLALREGQRLLFEPHDAALRRLLVRSLERALGELFERGAFGPARRSAAFQVSVGEGPDAAYDLDHGRLIADVRLAPAHALTMLTLRLIQTGDRGLLVVEA